jgi:hypothetical protein
MDDQLPQTPKGFPYFLQDYGKLLSHFQVELEPLGSKEKGGYFADFAQRLVPHSEIGRNFERPQKSTKETYDKGIDLSCKNKDGTQLLNIQAKYSISGVDDIDLIMSKFRSYQLNQETEPQFRLIPDPTKQLPMTRYMIVTAQDLHSRILPLYKKSKRESVRFYNTLESEGRLHIGSYLR